ncbi:hypothetical protein B0H19DRAFT_14707 [Mycena capillaripes]|nr:hypothetical protein B0H19DRAFT_14707 [Mycena capillaripes]
MMLFPDTPALAIFGPHSEEKMAKFAQKLADQSSFPVIFRPAEDNPMLRFQSDLSVKDIEVNGTGKTQMSDQILIFAVDPVVVMTAQISDRATLTAQMI